MKKLLIALVIAAVIATGVGIWYFVIRDESLEVSTKNVDTSKTEDIKESDSINGNWIIQQQDDVFAGYEIQELFGGDTVKKTAIGKSQEVIGRVEIVGNILTIVDVTVDTTQLKSDSSQRDSKMENEGLETNKFSDAVFQLTTSQNIEDKVKKNEDVKVTVKGQLILHGVTKDVSLEITVNWNGKVIIITGEHEIKLSDYEISPPDSSFVKVDDKGSIKFQLLFVPED